MHPTIERMMEVVAKGDADAIAPLLSPEVRFLPPTYWAVWQGRAAVAAVLGHVGQVFSDFHYRRVMGEGADWALEFRCKVGDLDAVGVDLITLDADGLIAGFEVAMRPLKSVAALREAMNAAVKTDARFIEFAKALRPGD
jgi:hypothetical protein